MIDVQIGINNCGGYVEDYISILQFVIEDSLDRMGSLDSFYNEEDYSNYVICVHAMKSTLASIGAMKVSEFAKELEMAGKEGRFEYIRTNHQEMMKLYQNTMKAAKQVLASDLVASDWNDDKSDEQEYETEEITMEEIKGYLENVTLLIEQFQYDDAEEVLKGILEFSMEEDTREVLKKILKDITMLRMDEALERIKEIS